MKVPEGALREMAKTEGAMQGFPDVNAPIYEWARFYRLELGFAVIPLKARSKRPALNAWRCYESRLPTEEELRGWFCGQDDLNIAIICGRVSGNLVVIDFDDMSVYPRFFDPRKIETGTLVVKTGSGKRHVYLRSDRPVRSFRIPELGIEIRSNGNYVVAPPSIHPDGGRYRFISPPGTGIAIVKDLVNSIWKRAEELGVKRRLSPEELQALLKRAKSPRMYRGAYRGPNPPCVIRALKGVPEGRRNDTCLWLAAYLINLRGLSVSKAREILYAYADRCTPPFNHREVDACIKSVVEHGYVFSCSNPRVAVFCDASAFESCPLKGRRFKEVIKIEG